MAVYVDALHEWTRTYRGAGAVQAARVGLRHGHQWCHLVADSLEELHAFAALLGMRREWFQGTHYDLTPSRRKRAVRGGAVEVGRAQFVAVLRLLRESHLAPTEAGVQARGLSRSFSLRPIPLDDERDTAVAHAQRERGSGGEWTCVCSACVKIRAEDTSRVAALRAACAQRFGSHG